MTRPAHSSARPTLAALSMQWLVLIVITLGIMVSSIGLTSSHGLAAIAASLESVQPSAVDFHTHVHADQLIAFTVAFEGSSGEHPHHGMDHSHDTAHHPSHPRAAVLSPPPNWEPMVRPRIELGLAYRLDRPPMG